MGLGANVVTITWYNGQVLRFDLDDPAQKAQHDAIQRFMASQASKPPEPTTTILYAGSALTPPQYPAYVLQTAGQPQFSAAAVTPSWLDQEMISGVPNKWLAGGALGFLALASLRRGGKGR